MGGIKMKRFITPGPSHVPEVMCYGKRTAVSMYLRLNQKCSEGSSQNKNHGYKKDKTLQGMWS